MARVEALGNTQFADHDAPFRIDQSVHATTMQPNHFGGQVTPAASTCLAAIRHGDGVVLRAATLTDQIFLVDPGHEL